MKIEIEEFFMGSLIFSVIFRLVGQGIQPHWTFLVSMWIFTGLIVVKTIIVGLKAYQEIKKL